MSIKAQISRTFGTRVVSTILLLVTSVFFTRLLGVGGKGEFAIFNTTISLFSLVFGFGLPSAIIYYTSNDKIDMSKLLTTSVAIILSLGFLFFIVVHYVQQGKSVSIFLHYNRSSWLYQILLVVCLILTLISVNMRAIIGAKKQFRTLNIFELTCAVTGFVVYTSLFFFSRNWATSIDRIDMAFLFFTALAVVYFIVICVFYFRLFPEGFSWGFLDAKSLKLLMSFAGIAYIGNIVQFLNYSADLWLVDYFTTPQQLGIYSLSTNLAQMLWVLPQSIATVLMPYISAGDDESILTKMMKIGRVTLFIYTLGTILSFFIMEPLMVVVYGEAFRQSAFVFNVLLIGTIPFCLTVIYSTYFSGNNKQYINVYAALIGIIFTLSLDFLLIPKYGCLGAAIASSCSYLVTSIFIIYHILKESEVNIIDIVLLKKQDIQMIFDKIRNK